MGQILNKFCPPPKKRKTKQWESRVTELLNFLFLISWESKFYRNSFSLSLFVMLVTNSIFFSFLKKKTQKSILPKMTMVHGTPIWDLWQRENRFLCRKTRSPTMLHIGRPFHILKRGCNCFRW